MHFGTASFYFVSIASRLLSSASSIAATATLMVHNEITVEAGVNGSLPTGFAAATAAQLERVSGVDRGARAKTHRTR